MKFLIFIKLEIPEHSSIRERVLGKVFCAAALRHCHQGKDDLAFSSFLKGQCHKMNIFIESFDILISAFCVCADGFQGLSKAFHFPTQQLTFY
jgi:hypothetical protein